MADVLADVRSRILGRFGEGGIHTVARRFRTITSARLTQVQLESGLADCGVALSTSEARRLLRELDADEDNTIAAASFLNYIRGSIPKCRMSVVEEAWKRIDPTNNGAATEAELRAQFDARRIPAVIKGEVAAEEAESNFFSGLDIPHDGKISKDDFVDYYAGVSAVTEKDPVFVVLLQACWRLDQPAKRISEEHMKQLIKDNFATSAYRGVLGIPEPLPQEEEIAPHTAMRNTVAVCNAIDPFHIPKPGHIPKGLSGAYVNPGKGNHKVKTFRGGEEFLGSFTRFDGEASQTGRVPNGLPDSKGFLDFTSTSKSLMGTGTMDDDVKRVLEEGTSKELALAKKREELKSTPFATADPPAYVRSTQDHCNMLVPSMKVKDGKAITIHSQRSPTTPTASTSPVDAAALAETLKQKQQASLPRGYRPRPTGGAWETTNQKEHAKYSFEDAEKMNERCATQPVAHASKALSDEAAEAIRKRDERFARRHEGAFETEYSSNIKNRFDEAEVCRDHDVKGTFNLRNGIPTMHHLSHHPRDVKTGESFSPAEIVPHQFLSTTKHLHRAEGQ